jgi:hypothetical protein
MQEKHIYEYAVIRVMPRVEREEFLNVGIILFCKHARFIKVLYKLEPGRLKCFSNDLDVEQLESNLSSFDKISQGARDGGPIAREDVASRFRWLTATRSSVLQTSRPHPGLCADLEKTAQKLFQELVL